MRHTDPPEPGDLSQSEFDDAVEGLSASPYADSVRALSDAITGKKVASTEAGTSGYLLRFDDDSWVAAHFNGERFEYQLGDGTVPDSVQNLLSSDHLGDASEPLEVDLPYADESCDIEAEVAKCRGHVVETVGWGNNLFHPCFDGSMVLQSMVVPNRQNRPALRVFWERW